MDEKVTRLIGFNTICFLASSLLLSLLLCAPAVGTGTPGPVSNSEKRLLPEKMEGILDIDTVAEGAWMRFDPICVSRKWT